MLLEVKLEPKRGNEKFMGGTSLKATNGGEERRKPTMAKEGRESLRKRPNKKTKWGSGGNEKH